ncbi:MAG: aminotransferase class V-fold PLP-dependent enzyme [Geminicoccaceae bacterium]|nr:aminotransferase class V-fold PLP-dependent enzyme [Geminicoccaceae bacterium]
MGQALRPHFPAFAHQPPPFHYLDNAATAQICAPAAEALLRFETRTRANVKRGVHRLADAATTAFEGVRADLARYLGVADPDEVVLTTGTTAGLNIAANGLRHRLGPGDEVLVTELEHHSDLVPWHLAAEATGATVRAIPVGEDGRLDLDRLGRVLNDRTRIVTVAHVSNVTGTVTDLPRLAAATHAVGAVLVVDGAQGAPHGPLDLPTLGCDLYALSGHKMFGPTGSGALWGQMDLLAEMPPFMGGGEMIRRVTIEGSTFAPPPHRFEAGTPAIGPLIGMGAAARFLMTLDWNALRRHEARLTGRVLEGLAGIEGIRVFGPPAAPDRVGVVTFTVDGLHAHDVCQILDAERGVALRGGHHCAQPLMGRFGLVASARASLAPYSDDDDVDALIEGLDDAIRRFR